MSQSNGGYRSPEDLESILEGLLTDVPASARTQTRAALEQAFNLGWTRHFQSTGIPQYVLALNEPAQNGLPHKIVDANTAAERFYGYSRAELRTMSALDLRAPSEHLAIAEHLANPAIGKVARADGVWRHQKKSGEEAFVRVSSSLLPARGQRLVLASIEDITAEIAAQRVLEESEERMHAIFDTAQDMIIVTDAQGNIAYYNKAVEEVTGHQRHKRLGASVFDNVHPADVHRCRELLSLPSAHTEVRIKGADGAYSMYEIASSDQRENKRIGGYVLTGRCIEDRVKLQAELVHAQRMESIGVLAGGVAHDFNNLLTVISANAEFIHDDAAEQTVKDEAANIRHAAGRAADLTRQLLAFSRKSPLNPTTFDVAEYVLKNEKMLRRILDESIDYSTHALQPLYVHADQTSIDQVLMNLVVNARDALIDRRGSITVRAREERVDERSEALPGLKPGAYALLTVTDTGTGIPAAIQNKIFDPFFTTKEQGKGTGLGLSTVYGIVKQSGGYIYVSSTEGAGSTFSVYLPLQEDAGSMDAHVHVERTRAQGSVLLVEDEDVVRAAAKQILVREGYTVHDFARPGAALQFATHGGATIDVVLTDMVMPEMSGTELGAALSRVLRGKPIIYMSGYPRDQSIAHLGPDAQYLQKPFRIHDLNAAIRNATEKKD